jgi:hypothetical protein
MMRRRVLDLETELRGDAAAAREQLAVAEAALADAQTMVPVTIVDADPDDARRRASAVEATRSAALIEYRTLGARPDFDAAAEEAAILALRALDDADAATRAVGRQSHFLLALGNVLGLGAIGHATFRFIVWAADPVSASTAAAVFAGGSFPAIAVAVGAARTLWSVRRTRRLRPNLDAAVHAGGCRTVRELADRRDDHDRWERRARLAAAAADRCAMAVNDWYEVAGIGADPNEVDDLLARAEWYRVTRAAATRARVAHRVAAARVARAEILSVGGQPPAGADAEPASDRIQIALLRLRRGGRLAWRRAS